MTNNSSEVADAIASDPEPAIVACDLDGLCSSLRLSDASSDDIISCP
jgi:hypothetical protein